MQTFYQELLHYIKSFVRALIETHVIVHYNTIDAPGNVRVHQGEVIVEREKKLDTKGKLFQIV